MSDFEKAILEFPKNVAVESVTPYQAEMSLKLAVDLLNGGVEAQNRLGENDDNVFAELSPDTVARILMNVLPADVAMTLAAKKFWMAVAVEMGSDWLAQLRKTGAFMATVEKF